MHDQNPIEELVHLYVDGAFSRRELMARLSKYAGGTAAGAVALAELGVGEAEAQIVGRAVNSVPIMVPAPGL